MKIPIPSIEKQEEIIKECEFYDNLIESLELNNEKNKILSDKILNGIF